MILPKLTRQQIRAAKGTALEITIPKGEQCGKWKTVAVTKSAGAKALLHIFVESVEHRGKQRVALVREVDQPRFMAKVSGATPVAAQSIDPDAELVPEGDQRRFTVEARTKFAAQLEEDASEEQAAKQQRAMRQFIRESVRDLGPSTGQLFLAKVQQMAEEVRDDLSKAA